MEQAEAPTVPVAGEDVPAIVRRSVWLWRLGTAAVFAYLLFYHYHHQTRDRAHLGDLPTFYQAAQFAREHRHTHRAGQTHSQLPVPPPLIAFLYVPLTSMPLNRAGQIMLALNAGMLLASLLLGARAMLGRMGRREPELVWAAAFLVSLLN